MADELSAAADEGAPPGQRCEGRVATWHGTWGFIEASDGRRAFAHNTSCGGHPLVPGQSVVIDIVPDPRNPEKWQARNIERQPAFDASGNMTGVVSEWWSTYGFIQFSDGRRAYCHSSSCQTPLQEGELVVGTLVDDPKNLGKFQAVDVKRAQSFSTAGYSEKVAGVVTSWIGRYGFIDFADGRRAYCHSSACGGGQLYEGQEVMAMVVEDERNPGKWQAQEVERAGPAQHEGKVLGHVVQWSGTWGFIQFSDGRRAHVHTTGTGGVTLQEGDSVLGLVVEDSVNAGKWQAVQVERAHPNFMPGPAAQHGQMHGGRVEGIVTEWNEKGYGFVECSDGRRAFVHNSSCDGGRLEMGQIVSAVITEDERNPGKWQAWDVQSPAAGGYQAGGYQAGGYQAGGYQAPRNSKLQAPARRQLKPRRRCGSVTEWNERGFGFVLFDDGTRAYLHNSECGGEHLSPTELVSADVVPDPRTPGKWQAVNVVRGAMDLLAPAGGCPLPGGSPLLANLKLPGHRMTHLLGAVNPLSPVNARLGSGFSAGLGRRQGTITDWNNKGYGFMRCQDGTRAFVHAAEFAGEHLAIGDEVEADLVPDGRSPGKWQAVGISRLGGQEPDSKRPRWVLPTGVSSFQPGTG